MITGMIRWVLPFIGGLAAMAAVLTTRSATTAPDSLWTEPDGQVARDASPEPSRADELSQAFRMAAQAVLPALVEIKSSGRPPSQGQSPKWRGPFRGNDLWDDFSSDNPIGMTGPFSDEASEGALGSGVIIDASGIVLTNYHIVEDADQLFIQTADGRQYQVVEIRTDAASDLAALRFKSPTPVPTARLGDSNRLQIGDWVLTVGSPLNLRQTVSAGIISAKGRVVDGAGDIGLLQTDAAINPGSSGGALVNLRGELVGITTAIASDDGGYQGIGFAVPANLAKRVVAQLQKHGEVTPSDIAIGRNRSATPGRSVQRAETRSR